MSNTSKTVRITKIRTQLAKLFVQLSILSDKENDTSMAAYFERRSRHHLACERKRQIQNIKKKIEFLNRKLAALGAE